MRVVGVASGGTPADLEAAGRQMDGGAFSGLFFAATVGLSRQYPELLTLLNDAVHALVADIGDMCVAEATISYPFRRLRDYATSNDPLGEPVAQAVLDENEMGGMAPAAPVYVYHSRIRRVPLALRRADPVPGGAGAAGGLVRTGRTGADVHGHFERARRPVGHRGAGRGLVPGGPVRRDAGAQQLLRGGAGRPPARGVCGPGPTAGRRGR
ncbi:MAG TPA: lipase family protein [Acidimicrobiales bacterium]